MEKEKSNRKEKKEFNHGGGCGCAAWVFVLSQRQPTAGRNRRSKVEKLSIQYAVRIQPIPHSVQDDCCLCKDKEEIQNLAYTVQSLYRSIVGLILKLFYQLYVKNNTHLFKMVYGTPYQFFIAVARFSEVIQTLHRCQSPKQIINRPSALEQAASYSPHHPLIRFLSDVYPGLTIYCYTQVFPEEREKVIIYNNLMYIVPIFPQYPMVYT